MLMVVMLIISDMDVMMMKLRYMGNYNNDSSDGDYYHKGDDVDDGIQMAKLYTPRLYLGVFHQMGKIP